MSEVNWAELVLGALIAVAVPVAWQVALLVYRRMRKNDLCGTWYEYNLSRRDGDMIVVREVWQVSPSLRHELHFTAVGEGYAYSGSMTKERHHLVADYRGKGHEESVYCRFELPATTGARQMLGLWVGFDFDNNLVAGPQILSRADLPDEDRRARLLQIAVPEEDGPLLALRLPRWRRVGPVTEPRQ
ncbi:hypothetical protein [Nocardioides speluncae]|uniref:hypothetical protein n=1 Tax=Nocardioides speluncae TaxID=2670337 RepID=UPI000D68FA13|nr:hypothetical protein [Nocardioides speluncae]